MLEKLGERIRQLRKEKKITLIEVSKKTGIAQATLSRIETGTMRGTVESHEKIADVLGISLAELYAGIDKRYDKTTLTKPDERKVTYHSKNVQIEVLTQEITKKKISPLLITLQPQSETQKEQTERGVEKFLFLLEGEVRVRLEKEEFMLKPGESLYFEASLPHQILNEKPKTARLLVAVSPAKI